MTERPFYSIGDVLALLRDEFPEITISKIRFLESRGLLDPERTPSGFRRFNEGDVDRLRWILRQQRENFLPLKVIKGRLEGEPVEAEVETPPTLFEVPGGRRIPPVTGASELLETGPVEREPVLRELAQVGADGAFNGAVSMRERGGDSGQGFQPAAAPPPEPRVATTPPGPAKSSGKEAKRAYSRQPDEPAGGSSEDASPAPVAPVSPIRPLEEQVGQAVVMATGGEEGHGRSRDPAASNPPAPAPAPAPAPKRSHGRSKRSPKTLETGASLSAAELSAACSLSLEEIDELEDYGLIKGKMVAGVRCYDEEGLIVARLAAKFARHGIEARHLRMFKHAADRQVGLYEQIVTPLLRQRNPEARAKATDTLDELTGLGASFQKALLAAMLRDITG